MKIRAAALLAVGCLIVAACSTSHPDSSCPADMPSNGGACNLVSQSSVPGSVPVCGYTTETNACGAVNCYCEHGAWGCNPTCAIVDASGVDHSVPDASNPDATLVDANAEGAADGDASPDVDAGPGVCGACTTDQECQSACPVEAGTPCCDVVQGVCYGTTAAACPSSDAGGADAACDTGSGAACNRIGGFPCPTGTGKPFAWLCEAGTPANDCECDSLGGVAPGLWCCSF